MIKVKIRGYQTDLYGHLNNARYLEIYEEARWDALQKHDLDTHFFSLGMLFFIVNTNVNYVAEVKLNDEIEVHTRTEKFGNKSVVIHQEMRNTKGELMSDAKITFVLFDKNTKQSVTLTPEIKAKFKLI